MYIANVNSKVQKYTSKPYFTMKLDNCFYMCVFSQNSPPPQTSNGPAVMANNLFQTQVAVADMDDSLLGVADF